MHVSVGLLALSTNSLSAIALFTNWPFSRGALITPPWTPIAEIPDVPMMGELCNKLMKAIRIIVYGIRRLKGAYEEADTA